MANYSTLQMGSSGQDVEKLQNALINAGYDVEGGADGVFGSKTDAALREYQKANGLTVDGIAGNQTLGKLYGDAAESGPTEYEKTMQELGDLKDAWLNRPDFQYDMSKDPFYQQYRDQFMSQGQLAMMDTMGQAAALTGGYGSTYAQAAGQQAYQAYLQQLNDVMPELYGMARDQYDREGEDLYNRLSMMMAEQEAAANIMAQTGDYTRLGDLYGLSEEELQKISGAQNPVYYGGNDVVVENEEDRSNWTKRDWDMYYLRRGQMQTFSQGLLNKLQGKTNEEKESAVYQAWENGDIDDEFALELIRVLEIQ